MQSGEKDKIYQGEGPFVINFKETPDYVKFIFYFFLQNVDDKFNRIYLNLDGEFYNIIKPIEMRIRLAKRINNGKLKFLKKF